MNPSALEKLTIILFVLSFLFFAAAIVYAVKFKVISSLMFELGHKKDKTGVSEPVTPQAAALSTENAPAAGKPKITGTVSIRKKPDSENIIGTVPAKIKPEKPAESSDTATENNNNNNDDEDIATVYEEEKIKPSVSPTVPSRKFKKDPEPSEPVHEPVSEQKKRSGQSATIPARNRKTGGYSVQFIITKNITVLQCSEEDLRFIDEA